MKYGQELPKEVEKSLDEYIERIKKIQWFKPSADLKKKEVEKQVSVVLKAFGVEGKVEYRKLVTPDDWDAAWDDAVDAACDAVQGAAWDAACDAVWDDARDVACDDARDDAVDAAWDAVWDDARDAARDAARDDAWGVAWGVACDAARDAAWDAARGATDLLAMEIDKYKEKYPNGTFVNIIPLWEMGLYPIGLVDGKFVIYVPPVSQEFPDLF